MTYRLVTPDANQLTNAGYELVAHIPFLIRSDGSYPDLANRYIRARALCEWKLQLGCAGSPTKSKLRFQTVQSCISLARKMMAFLKWTERKVAKTGAPRNVESITGRDLFIWQDGLSNGSMSISGVPLQPSTINSYVLEACYFLTWLSLVPKTAEGRPLRPPFHVETHQVQINTHSGDHSQKTMRPVDVRIGALDTTPLRELNLPIAPQVDLWLLAMRARSPVKALMAEVVLSTGMRISEVNSLEVETLPRAEDWKVVAGYVHFPIKKGVKGKKVTPTSNIAVRGRTISMPIAVARKVDEYRNGARELQLRRWIREPEDKAEQVRRSGKKPTLLWLSESSNAPFDSEQLRRVWSDTANRIAEFPRGWSPHDGRRYFAVEWLVEYTQNTITARAGGVDAGWMDALLRDQINTFLRPVLGHLSVETTNLYIRAAIWRLIDVLGIPSLKHQDAQDQEARATLENGPDLEAIGLHDKQKE